MRNLRKDSRLPRHGVHIPDAIEGPRWTAGTPFERPIGDVDVAGNELSCLINTESIDKAVRSPPAIFFITWNISQG